MTPTVMLKAKDHMPRDLYDNLLVTVLAAIDPDVDPNASAKSIDILRLTPGLKGVFFADNSVILRVRSIKTGITSLAHLCDAPEKFSRELHLQDALNIDLDMYRINNIERLLEYTKRFPGESKYLCSLANLINLLELGGSVVRLNVEEIGGENHVHEVKYEGNVYRCITKSKVKTLDLYKGSKKYKLK